MACNCGGMRRMTHEQYNAWLKSKAEALKPKIVKKVVEKKEDEKQQ